MESKEPGRFKPVAEAGSAFFNRYLTKQSVFDYMAALLRSYAAMYNQQVVEPASGREAGASDEPASRRSTQQHPSAAAAARRRPQAAQRKP
jgi:hypothetical protein